ncbi:histone-lysine N-methyltransferase SETD1B-like isoform X1 [Corvus moneduloides]|uniref:histone-lysine N-methyltransferase SETD1B-like isoform X1 n=1 Tax=Corvus moneduloides TaxID=1196302 RepID=UPI001362CAB8|nr:histone-lysine N-methyltransferase SETD1B-like isoform X1 [Corvus moneduloides]XP_031963157.1 histone-lysine N-methyltransferase SETD1B-like isoform X1 [Corvus moneduloides]
MSCIDQVQYLEELKNAKLFVLLLCDEKLQRSKKEQHVMLLRRKGKKDEKEEPVLSLPCVSDKKEVEMDLVAPSLRAGLPAVVGPLPPPLPPPPPPPQSPLEVARSGGVALTIPPLIKKEGEQKGDFCRPPPPSRETETLAKADSPASLWPPLPPSPHPPAPPGSGGAEGQPLQPTTPPVKAEMEGRASHQEGGHRTSDRESRERISQQGGGMSVTLRGNNLCLSFHGSTVLLETDAGDDITLGAREPSKARAAPPQSYRAGAARPPHCCKSCLVIPSTNTGTDSSSKAHSMEMDSSINSDHSSGEEDEETAVLIRWKRGKIAKKAIEACSPVPNIPDLKKKNWFHKPL